jgi:hypothetical protein
MKETALNAFSLELGALVGALRALERTLGTPAAAPRTPIDIVNEARGMLLDNGSASLDDFLVALHERLDRAGMDPGEPMDRINDLVARYEITSGGIKIGHEKIADVEKQRDEALALFEALQKDMEEAAGELLVALPEPGSTESKLLAANVKLRNELAKVDDALTSIRSQHATMVRDFGQEMVNQAQNVRNAAALLSQTLCSRITEGVPWEIGADPKLRKALADALHAFDEAHDPENDYHATGDRAVFIQAVRTALKEATDA